MIAMHPVLFSARLYLPYLRAFTRLTKACFIGSDTEC